MGLKTSLAVVFATLVAATSIAEAQVPPKQRVEFTDPKTESRSGGSGVAARLEAKSQYQYLLGLNAWEDKDKPCQVRARFAHVNELNEFEQTWTDPECKSPGSEKTVSVYGDNGTGFIKSLKVCLAYSGRVKGVAGSSVTVARSALLADAYRPGAHVDIVGNGSDVRGFERVNCANVDEPGDHGWQPASACGDDRVATGVVIEQKDGSWTSLRLICSFMIPKQ